MTMKKLLASGASVLLAGALATAAVAQPAPPRPAAAPAAPAAPAAAPISVTHGPAIANVCVVSVDGILANSLVGKAAIARLQQLESQIRAEMSAEQNQLQADIRTFQQTQSTMDAATKAQREAALNQRIQAFQRKDQQRAAEMEATKNKAFDRIFNEAKPVLAQAYAARTCSILINANAIVITNPQMDLTDQVVALLNTRIQTITFDRENLSAPAPGAAPAAPR
ncbi:MAG: OmpH family outer membrane protein [Caulobacteraceae bacterium]